jgi:hypothetical protein
MQHYTFYKLLGSPLFYVTCLMPVMLCFYIDLMIQAVTVMIFTDPQNLIRLYLKNHNKLDFDEDFLEQFKELCEVQQRYLIIDNYFNEENLEYSRVK